MERSTSAGPSLPWGGSSRPPSSSKRRRSCGQGAPRPSSGWAVHGQFAMQASVFKQAGLAKKCKAAWDKAVVLDPNNLDVREDLIQYYLRAPGFMGGSVEKAREQAAEIKNGRVRGSLATVTVQLHQKENAAAEKELAEAIRKAPADPRPRYTLGALQQEGKRWNEAFETFEAALKTNPDDYDALYQVGKTGALSGQRLDRAEECLKRYLGHTPSQRAPALRRPLPAGHGLREKGQQGPGADPLQKGRGARPQPQGSEGSPV